MDTDENSDLLEQHLKILGQKIRLDILKKINMSVVPLSYSALQREVLGDNSNSTNFAFHLKMLKNSNLIDQMEDGYSITILGKKILNSLVSIEQILNEQNKSIMIRTSKYATEPFNLQKVESYLINEGKMETYHAKQIAKEVSERLSKTNIQYLTTPLMREYINGILLENGLEEIRHRLTRLGTPPSEPMNLFKNNEVSPQEFIIKLGCAASEQFLLLNLLPKQLADLYLSSEIVLLNLNTWSLKPLAFYCDSQEFIRSFLEANPKDMNNSRDLYSFMTHFFRITNKIQSFFSEDFLIGTFDQLIKPLYQDSNGLLFDMFTSEMMRMDDSHSQLSLEFPDLNSEFEILTTFLTRFKDANRIPNIILNYSDLNSETFKQTFNELDHGQFASHVLFNNQNNDSILNSITVDIRAPNKDLSEPLSKNIVLDKILINLHAIALSSNGNDDSFEEILVERINDCFKLFVVKQDLLHVRLNQQKDWKNLFSSEDLQNSLKVISFFGLNEAVKSHCGIELDRTQSSETFAIKILDSMNQVIREETKNTSNNYLLSQPHLGEYLKET
ncbi:MAG: hypothetical protein EU533_05265, partial [Promethearchaeota archaeon]